MKVSLICTMKNEEATVKELLDSILNQTLKPDEVIIVDGGSKDRTYKILKEYSRKITNLRIFQKRSNIAQGRNFAIEKAKHPIIASTDGGCVLDKNWLKEITKPFPNADVVSGVFKPLTKTFFERIQGIIVSKDIEKLTHDFPPSSRSLAFKKAAWKAVGGYPEYLYTGEDTLFNLKLREKKFRFVLAPKAIVYWRMRPTLKKFAKQFYTYGYGDIKAGNIFKMKLNLLFMLGSILYTSFLIATPFYDMNLFYLLLILGFLYFFQKGVYALIKSKTISALFYGTIIFFIKRMAYLLGLFRGLL